MKPVPLRRDEPDLMFDEYGNVKETILVNRSLVTEHYLDTCQELEDHIIPTRAIQLEIHERQTKAKEIDYEKYVPNFAYLPISLPLFILYLWQVELENSCSRTRRLLRHSGRVVAASTYQHHQCDDVGFLFLFSLLQENERQPSFIASRNRKIFYKALSRAQRRLRDRRIPRSALKDPYHSAWRTLLQSNNDQAMITLTGLDYETFNWLLAHFESLYKNYTPFTEDGRIMKLKGGVKGAGRPRLLSAADCLGLNLAWTRLRGSAIALQIIFGMPGTSVSMYLRFGRRTPRRQWVIPAQSSLADSPFPYQRNQFLSCSVVAW